MAMATSAFRIVGGGYIGLQTISLVRREVPLSAAEGVSEGQEVDDSVIVGCILDDE
jgi:hypothetical protein